MHLMHFFCRCYTFGLTESTHEIFEFIQTSFLSLHSLVQKIFKNKKLLNDTSRIVEFISRSLMRIMFRTIQNKIIKGLKCYCTHLQNFKNIVCLFQRFYTSYYNMNVMLTYIELLKKLKKKIFFIQKYFFTIGKFFFENDFHFFFFKIDFIQA